MDEDKRLGVAPTTSAAAFVLLVENELRIELGDDVDANVDVDDIPGCGCVRAAAVVVVAVVVVIVVVIHTDSC